MLEQSAALIPLTACRLGPGIVVSIISSLPEPAPNHTLVVRLSINARRSTGYTIQHGCGLLHAVKPRVSAPSVVEEVGI